MHLNDPIVLRKTDQVQGSGVLLFFDTPITLTLKDALTMMIVMSDNTATNLAIDHIGLANIDSRIQKMGLKNTYLYRKVFQPAGGPIPAGQKRFGLGKTTPREMAEVMQKIVNCDLAEPGTPSQPGDQKLCESCSICCAISSIEAAFRAISKRCIRMRTRRSPTRQAQRMTFVTMLPPSMQNKEC